MVRMSVIHAGSRRRLEPGQGGLWRRHARLPGLAGPPEAALQVGMTVTDGEVGCPPLSRVASGADYY
jgi:hypothetical protein